MSDEQRARALRPRARILRTFGDELISSPTVAVIELVKNAYDADATSVLVRLLPPLDEPSDAAIEVLDNGHGMSLETIEAAWMEPATLFRKQRTRSEKLGRRVLGEKGIGRFATSRLADHLEVISRRAEADTETHVVFDWTAFDDEEKYLDEIEATYWQQEPVELAPGGSIDALGESRKPRDDQAISGTLLRMRGLRQLWTAEAIQELRVGLARLVSPFESEQQAGFRITLELPEPYTELSGPVEPPELLERPHHSLAGDVAADGSYKFELRLRGASKAEALRGQFQPDGRTPTCGPFHFELRVWDRDPESLRILAAEEGETLKSVRADLDQAAGINIYRNGFRVLPYGEPRNDWLRLDIRRVQNPTLRLSNNQIVGYVLISADENPELRDQSNREGLIENQAFNDLESMLVSGLNELESRRYTSRRTITPQPRGGIFAGFSLAELRAYIREHHPSDERLLELVSDATDDLARRVEEAQDVIARYRHLATLGQLIDTVLHDGRAPLAKVRYEAELGLRDIARNANGSLVPRLGDRLQTIHTQSDVMAIVFRRIEPFGGRRRGRPRRLPVEKIIADTFDVLETEIASLGVEVDLPTSEHVVSVDPAELEEVLLNLLQNSLWWLRQMPEGSRRIAVLVTKHDDRLEIVQSDSGPGVSAEFTDRIFDPYFSTKPNGVGLGLTIAGEIAGEYYGGSLELLEKGPLPGATFRVTLRRRI